MHDFGAYTRPAVGRQDDLQWLLACAAGAAAFAVRDHHRRVTYPALIEARPVGCQPGRQWRPIW